MTCQQFPDYKTFAQENFPFENCSRANIRAVAEFLLISCGMHGFRVPPMPFVRERGGAVTGRCTTIFALRSGDRKGLKFTFPIMCQTYLVH
jgi:hypothetical protein